MGGCDQKKKREWGFSGYQEEAHFLSSAGSVESCFLSGQPRPRPWPQPLSVKFAQSSLHQLCRLQTRARSALHTTKGNKTSSGAHSGHHSSLPSIHFLPSAGSVEFCLLCCQPELCLSL